MDFIAPGEPWRSSSLFDKMPRKEEKKIKLAFSFSTINKGVFGEPHNRRLYRTHKKTKVRSGCDDKDLQKAESG